jgi:hypothetical protein
MSLSTEIRRAIVSRLIWLTILLAFLAGLALLGLGIWFSEISLEGAMDRHAVWWVVGLEGAKVAALVVAFVFVAAQPLIALVERGKSALWRHGRRSSREDEQE